MTLTNPNRVKLAEAMGWHKATSLDIWCRPEDQKRQGKNYTNGELPDPYTDANDCEALIWWLERAHLIWLTVGFGCGQQADIDAYYDDGDSEFHWAGDDWKQGVCELALKVLDSVGDRLNQEKP